jgi:hypothetical protein
MGMDLFGNAPISDQGAYFRCNIWWWHPLWKYCEETAPDIIPSDNLGHFNDGWGLGKTDSLALADRLAGMLASGETQAYEKRFMARRKALPSKPCTVCGGTGRCAEPPQSGPGPRPCNACDGKGMVPDFETNHPFSAEIVRGFEAFLRDCGGFQIG